MRGEAGGRAEKKMYSSIKLIKKYKRERTCRNVRKNHMQYIHLIKYVEFCFSKVFYGMDF